MKLGSTFNKIATGAGSLAGRMTGMLLGKTANSLDAACDAFKALSEGNSSKFLQHAAKAVAVKLETGARLTSKPFALDPAELKQTEAGKKSILGAFKQAHNASLKATREAPKTPRPSFVPKAP